MHITKCKTTKKGFEKMEKSIPFSAHARLEHNGQLLGYRFTASPDAREYFDISVSELGDLTDIPFEELEKYVVSEGTSLRKISSYLDENLVISLSGSSVVAKNIIPVDVSMKPIRQWSQEVTLHRRGLTTKVPFVTPEYGLKIVTIMDNLLYGSNLRNIFNVMSIDSVEFWSPKVGFRLKDAAIGQTVLQTSFYVKKIDKVELMEQWCAWCSQYGVKNVELEIKPLKNVYQFILHFVYSAEEETNSYVPFKAQMPVLSGKTFHSQSVPVYMSPNRKRKNTIDKYLLHTVTGDAYSFVKYEDIEATGAKVSNASEFFLKSWRNVNFFYFARKVVNNGEVYEFDICRKSEWVKSHSSSIAGDILKAMDGVYANTVLDDILLEDSCDLPILTCPTTKNGTLSVIKKVDFSTLPISASDLKETLLDEWEAQTLLWRRWHWRDISAIKALNRSIKFEKDSISFNIDFVI